MTDDNTDNSTFTFRAEKHGDYTVVAYQGEKPYAYSETGVFWYDSNGTQLSGANDKKICHEYRLAGRPRHGVNHTLLTIIVFMMLLSGLSSLLLLISILTRGG